MPTKLALMRSAACFLCVLLAGCHAYRFGYVSDLRSGTVATSSAQGASVAVSTDSRLVAGIIVAVLLAEGIRYYLRGPDGTLTPLERAPEPDPSRKVSEQDCTLPLARDGGNLRCK